ncbi:MAG: four helix bundle protein [Hydrococcus sp. Prado102]|jgi:four helix bundle protein|nr:four helix bundle protein [Hydrococcus sp. Prado102]
MSNYIPIDERTKTFAIRIIKLCAFLNKQDETCKVLAKQLLRSGTSIGANIAESRSAQSNRDFLNKMEIALKEARETKYWLELLIESALVPEKLMIQILQESKELIAILVASTDKIKKKN